MLLFELREVKCPPKTYLSNFRDTPRQLGSDAAPVVTRDQSAKSILARAAIYSMVPFNVGDYGIVFFSGIERIVLQPEWKTQDLQFNVSFEESND